MTDDANTVTPVDTVDTVDSVSALDSLDALDALDAINWAAAESLEYRVMQPETPELPAYTLDN